MEQWVEHVSVMYAELNNGKWLKLFHIPKSNLEYACL